MVSGPVGDRIAVRWGIVQAAYPFWRMVATQVRRLLRLQGVASANQVQRWLRKALGDRQTVYNATQRVLRPCVVGCSGRHRRARVYAPGTRVEVGTSVLAAWLVEALKQGGLIAPLPLSGGDP